MRKFVSRKLVPLFTLLIVAALVFSVAGSPRASAQSPVELRMVWYNDGNEGEVMRELLDRFEKENPDIKVVIDTIAFKDLHNILQTQVDAGEGPDMARITELGRFHGKMLDMTPHMKDPKAWEATFPAAALDWLRVPGGKDKGLYGFPSQFTVGGAFINKTLFEQAGVAIPTGKVTWPEWYKLAKEVAQKTQTPYAIAIDRSSHRIWGPAMSTGAVLIDPKTGRFTIDTPGFREWVQFMRSWYDENATPKEIWLGAGGQYAAGKDFFVRGELVFYFSGNWQVGAFTKEIGDAFDWDLVDTPCGPRACTAMPGGAAIIAMGGTKHPEAVTRVMEYMSSKAVLGEFSARSLFLPGQVELQKEGVDFVASKEVLNKFAAQIPKLIDEAYWLQGTPLNTPLNFEMRDRLTQYFAGELTLDETLATIQKKADELCDQNPNACLPRQ